MAAKQEDSEVEAQQAVQKAAPMYSALMGPMVTLYPLSCIKKRTKGKQFEKDRSVSGRFARQEQLYYQEGIRRTVDAILLVHDHGHPHVLMLHIDHKFWKLPGGKMKQGETELECLKRKLDQRLAPEPSSGFPAPEWKIIELAGTFYRPNFEQSMYPYQVPHITEPKEIKKLYVVTISGDCVFEFPGNYGIELVSLMDLMGSTSRFGPVASSIPFLVSRLINVPEALMGVGNCSIALTQSGGIFILQNHIQMQVLGAQGRTSTFVGKLVEKCWTYQIGTFYNENAQVPLPHNIANTMGIVEESNFAEGRAPTKLSAPNPNLWTL